MKTGIGVVLTAVFLLVGCDRRDDTSASNMADPPPGPGQGVRDKGGSLTLEALESDSTLGWLRTFRERYPEEYQAYGVKVDQVLARNPSLAAARVELTADVQPFMAARKLRLLKTPDAELVEYLRRNTVVIERLAKEDVQACTDAVHGNLRPDIQLPDATWKAMSDTTSQLLIAARAADANPTVRENVRLTPDDFLAWRGEMAPVGATEDTFEILTNPARKAAATAAEICQVRLIMMKAALQLPPPLAAKITLNLASSPVS